MDLIQDYLQYTKETEPPIIYHRWCLLSAVGALLGRSCHTTIGHFRVFPNLYTMLIGEPATRKSSSIKIGKKLLTAAGYETFAANKTRVEKFLMDVEGVQEPREVFIAADEFNEFAGLGNSDLYTTLGDLWDWDDPARPFTHRLKSSRSVSIFQPTVSLLGGNTPENFSKAFPPEVIGNGFLSRLILIYGERSGRKYAFPPVPTVADTEKISQQMRNIRARNFHGEIIFTQEAREICTDIYEKWEEPDDARFKGYYQRRYTQLHKLCTIVSACRGEVEICGSTVYEANTILAAAEMNMPRALGEFGKSRVSDVTNRILVILENARRPIPMQEIWKEAMRDLDKIDQLITIMNGLSTAKKVQFVKAASSGTSGYLLQKERQKEVQFVDFQRYLTQEERDMI